MIASARTGRNGLKRRGRVPTIWRCVTARACLASTALAPAAAAQSLTDRLARLFTADQRAISTPDSQASEATRGGLVQLFSVERVKVGRDQPLAVGYVTLELMASRASGVSRRSTSSRRSIIRIDRAHRREDVVARD